MAGMMQDAGSVGSQKLFLQSTWLFYMHAAYIHACCIHTYVICTCLNPCCILHVLVVVGHFVIFIPLHLAFTNWFCCISCKLLASLLLCLSQKVGENPPSNYSSQLKVDGWRANRQLSKQNGSDPLRSKTKAFLPFWLHGVFLSAETTARVLWQQLL